MQLQGTMGNLFGDKTDNEEEVIDIAADVTSPTSIPETLSLADLAKNAKSEEITKDTKKASPWLWVGAAAVAWFIFLRKDIPQTKEETNEEE